MKGYYCIYECSQNQWLMENQWWDKDKKYHTQTIGIRHAIQISQSYSYNPNLPQIEVIDTESANVLVHDGMQINPSSIHKFKTLSEAENYLLTAGFSTSEGQFYTIRKIYF